MSKFKVGDDIRAIHGCSNITVGNIYTVTSFCDPKRPEFFNDEKRSDAWGEEHFELAKSAPTELEQLVAIANAGYKAINELNCNYRDQLQLRAKFQDWSEFQPIGAENLNRELRIKPKPTFEPFTVGPDNCWIVNIVNDKFTIGCNVFDAKKLKSTIQTLMMDNCSSVESLDGKFYASRRGVSHKGNSVTWAEAEKILTALEKAGV